MDFEVRLHTDAVKFLLDLDQDTKERIKAGIKIYKQIPLEATPVPE
jgi:mRNA interferase RelE/StbE